MPVTVMPLTPLDAWIAFTPHAFPVSPVQRLFHPVHADAFHFAGDRHRILQGPCGIGVPRQPPALIAVDHEFELVADARAHGLHGVVLRLQARQQPRGQARWLQQPGRGQQAAMAMPLESFAAELLTRIRAGKAFIAVNMGGLPEGVFESELFGHVRGAFTDAKSDRAGRFELADSGTLFMDEIGNIPMSQQAKILRTLETGEFERVGSSRTSRTNVRLISATNSDLNAEVAAGKFRQDLLFRLNTIQLHLPPLRERREDIELLAQHFLKSHVDRYRKPITGFDASALDALKAYNWPGNVRELDHSVERGVLMAPGKVVRAADLDNLRREPAKGLHQGVDVLPQARRARA